jgi:ATP-dependent Zn protease
MNEAALSAAKNNREILTNNDMEYALEKIVM